MGRNQKINITFDPDGNGQRSAQTFEFFINERLDVPYQANLVRPDGQDAPYSVYDLESLLRRWDIDAVSHSKRLLQVAPITSQDPRSRFVLTTDSYDIPVPAFPIVDLLKEKLAGLDQNLPKVQGPN